MTTPAAGAEACEQDRHTIEVAIEAYYAERGRLPDAERELVDAGMLRAESGSYDLDDGEIVRVTGSPCDDEPIRTPGENPDPLTADGVVATWPDSLVTGVGGPDCAVQLAAIMAAGQNFINRENREPDTLAELEGDLDRPISLWEWSDDSLRPVDGSGCIDPNRASTEADAIRACRVERQTLQVAREAYLGQSGDLVEPTEDDLVEAGLLRAVSDSMDLVDGVVTASAGGSCDGLELDSEPRQPGDCDADRRVLEVATEAYHAQYGKWPAEEADLVGAGMLRTVSPGYDLLPDGVVVPTPGTGCE